MTRQLINLLVIILIITIAWAGFDFYHGMQNTTIPDKYRRVQPIEDSIDSVTLDNVDARQEYKLYVPFD